LQKDFNLGIALLHSFEYDESEKVFAGIIDEDPACAMAYWGVAMANYHTLWAPPTAAEFQKGSRAIAIARSIGRKSEREAAFISALATFYEQPETADHRMRVLRLEKAMEDLYNANPADQEAAIFYALILTGAADPTDKSFAKQKKAAGILKSLYSTQPDHPGINHYIIHSYDYPELAELALPEARKYASIASSSAHAQHMPSHIFTRLGLWEEGVRSNMSAANAAKCYAETTGIDGHWDEELHAIDYLVYSFLQQGDNNSALQQLNYLKMIDKVSPVNFKVAYAFSAAPSRYVLENHLWTEAAGLQLYPRDLKWDKYPWQKAIHHFARGLGFANTLVFDSARNELSILGSLRDTLLDEKDIYKANQVHIQIKTLEAWIAFKNKKNEQALALMNAATEMEDKTEKHAVTPGEVLPARELLGDMLLQMNQPAKALDAYEANLRTHPNRFNSLYGAATAAAAMQQDNKSTGYYKLLVALAVPGKSDRMELISAKASIRK
jgi:tetratricopeptide (TPR) repeat protein